MKRLLCCTSILISGFLLTGCGDKSADSTSSSSSSSGASGAPGAGDSLKAATGEMVEEVKKQSAEAVAQVQEKARAAYDELSQQLMASTKDKTDELLKELSVDLESRAQKLSEAVQDNQTLTEQLKAAVAALLGNQDTAAVTEMGGISTAKLTPEQTALAKEFYNVGAAFVTQRNFSSLEGSESDVAALVGAVRQGNYTQALTPLQKIYNQATLTPEQKTLLSTTFDQYAPAGWKDAAGSLQKGIDSLKSLGQ